MAKRLLKTNRWRWSRWCRWYGWPGPGARCKRTRTCRPICPTAWWSCRQNCWSPTCRISWLTSHAPCDLAVCALADTARPQSTTNGPCCRDFRSLTVQGPRWVSCTRYHRHVRPWLAAAVTQLQTFRKLRPWRHKDGRFGGDDDVTSFNIWNWWIDSNPIVGVYCTENRTADRDSCRGVSGLIEIYCSLVILCAAYTHYGNAFATKMSEIQIWKKWNRKK